MPKAFLQCLQETVSASTHFELAELVMDEAMCPAITGSQRFHITKKTLVGVCLTKNLSTVFVYFTCKPEPHMLCIGLLQELPRCICQGLQCLDPSGLKRLVSAISANICSKDNERPIDIQCIDIQLIRILNKFIYWKLHWQKTCACSGHPIPENTVLTFHLQAFNLFTM